MQLDLIMISLPTLAEDESLTAIAAEAAKRALDMAGVAAEDVDLVLLCTSSPDDLFGSATQVRADSHHRSSLMISMGAPHRLEPAFTLSFLVRTCRLRSFLC